VSDGAQPAEPALSRRDNPAQPAEPALSRRENPAQPAEPAASGRENPAQPAEPAASGRENPAQPAEPAASGPARERILAAAVERIAGDGIDDMRIARVAMDAGVSTSLVHYHFETREALLAEALEYSFELAGDVRLEEGEEEAALDPERRLMAMADQCLPYPGELQRDWVLWLELWLRTVRHPALRPTAAKLYARMRGWFADGIRACGYEGDADALADRTIALCDGFGVRVLIGELPIEEARDQIRGFLAAELGLDRAPAGG
jgi:AcrR family transcriptional regulator